MKLITFQEPVVLDILNTDGIYECDYISEYHKTSPKCYERLAQDIKNKTGLTCRIPIFAWSVVVPETELSITQIKRMNEMVGIGDAHIGLEMVEVPDEFILLQGFYNFVDAKYNEEFDDLEWGPVGPCLFF